MVHRPDIDDSLCFVLLPLRQPFLGYFDQIIVPAAREAGLNAIKASDIYGTRSVINDIWDHIWRAKAVVAIVSGRNPNVNYELGICHTLGIPTVLISDKKTDVPFDYQHRRYISYATENAGWEQALREDLTKTLKVAILPANPADELPWPYDIERLVAQGVVESLTGSSKDRDLILKGVSLVASGISGAYGPDGGGVAASGKFGDSAFAYDGTRIANSIGSPNYLQMQGIESMRRVANETTTRVGDFSKTAILIADQLIQRGEEALRSGQPLKALLEGMENAVETAAAFVLTQATAPTEENLKQVAMTASRDDEISQYVISATRRVGSDGVVTIDESIGDEHALEIQEGLNFDTGLLSRAFITDTQSQECVLENPFILIYEGNISRMSEFLPTLEFVARQGRSILIIAGDVTDEALATLVVNCQRGSLKVAAVKAPGFGDRRRHSLEDIAKITGGTAISMELGLPLSAIPMTAMGSAKRVVVTASTTVIVGGAGSEGDIEALVQQLRRQISLTQSAFDQEKLRERLAMLKSGVATIKVGGRSGSDRAKSKYSATSALFSVQTSQENGVVVGGGSILLRANHKIISLGSRTPAHQAGMNAVSAALREPALKIISNAKVADAGSALVSIIDSSNPMLGFNSITQKVEDLAEAGILDSARGVREALLVAMAHSRQVLGIVAWAVETKE